MPKGKKTATAKPKAAKPKAKKKDVKCVLNTEPPPKGGKVPVYCVKDCPYKGKIQNCKHKKPAGCKWARRG